MSISIQIVLSDNLYLRNPEQTELGRNIVEYSIKLIDELGLEKFTFKKLAVAINSTEASVYRYFQNKHKLLIYLVSWYWRWLEFLIDYQTHNIDDPERCLRIAIQVLANASTYDTQFPHIDEVALHRIVVAESSKTLRTKNVEGEKEEGLFEMYESLVRRLADIFLQVNADFPYPRSLAVSALDAACNQIFMAHHMAALSDLSIKDGDTSDIVAYLEHLILGALEK